jgi:hypothetical protein
MEDLNDGIDTSKTLLDLSEGVEDWAEVSCEVPEELSPDGKYHNYTVRVKKTEIVDSLQQDTFKDFWESVQKRVLEHLSK